MSPTVCSKRDSKHKENTNVFYVNGGKDENLIYFNFAMPLLGFSVFLLRFSAIFNYDHHKWLVG